jgi:hypothetical protein
MSTGIDFRTYKGAAGNGGVIQLTRPCNSLALSAQGTSVFWVRPRSSGDGLGAVTAPVATPDPAAQANAAWIRVSAAEGAPSAKAGGAVGVGAFAFPVGLQPSALEVWCDTDGASPYLAIIATQ